MEETGHIEIHVSNNGNTLHPKNIDIKAVTEMIADIETFLYPSRKEKLNRPKITYDLKEGSARHLFYLPVSVVLFFNALTAEVSKRGNLDFLEPKRQAVLDKFQKSALTEGFIFEFRSSLNEMPSLRIDTSTQLEMIAPAYYESEFYLYGEIYQEGGKTPNLHISTKEFGNLTISATKKQIMDGEKKTYRIYGVKVRGKKSLENEKPTDLELLEFLQYGPKYNKSLLDKVIERASMNLSKISDVDTWLDDIKAEGI